MEMDLTESSKQLRSLKPGSIQLLYTHRCQWSGCTNMSCKLCRQTRQRCFSYICNSQVVKSNRVNDQNRAETCLLKADCGDCVAITAIALAAAIQERPMTHLQLSLIAESEEVHAIIKKQNEQVQPRSLVEQLMEHAIVTPDILKAHLTPGAFHMDGHLLVPIEDLKSGYGLQGKEVSALPLSVYIDCPLRDIRNNNHEAVKSVHLLVVAANIDDGNKQILDHVIPALSSPFTLFTRRRDIKSPFPKTADPVTEVSDIADATARKLQNLRANAPNADVNILSALPETPIETVKQLHDFIAPLEDEMLVYISRYVLRRPADCLTKLKRRLQERMISEDNDTAPRLWSSPTAAGVGLLYSASEGAVNLQYSSSNPSFMLNNQLYHHENAEAHRSSLHDQAVQDWHRQDHGLVWSLLREQGPEQLSALPSFESDMGPWPQLEGSDPEALPDLGGHANQLALPSIASAFPLDDLPGHIVLVSTSQAQPAGHPEQYHLDREWAVEGNMDAMQGSRDMVIGPMTDSFVQILHQIHDPDSHGQTVHHAWLNDLEESFNRSMKLDEEEAAQEPGGREGLTVPLDVSMNSVLSQPLTWSFTSLELPEGVSNPLGPSQHANHWSQGPDIPVSGSAFGSSNVICMHEELESPFDSFRPPDE